MRKVFTFIISLAILSIAVCVNAQTNQKISNLQKVDKSSGNSLSLVEHEFPFRKENDKFSLFKIENGENGQMVQFSYDGFKTIAGTTNNGYMFIKNDQVEKLSIRQIAPGSGQAMMAACLGSFSLNANTSQVCDGGDAGNPTMVLLNGFMIADPSSNYSVTLRLGATIIETVAVPTNAAGNGFYNFAPVDPPVGNQNYQIDVTGPGGCSSTGIASELINCRAEIMLSMVTGNTSPYCDQDAVALSLSATAPEPITWDPSPNFTNGSFVSGVSFGGGNFNATAINTTGQTETVGVEFTARYNAGTETCPSTSPIENFDVKSPPQNVNIVSDATANTICEGSSTTLTASSSDGSAGDYTFTWQDDNSTNPMRVVSPVTTTQYDVAVSNGCSPDASQFIEIIVIPTPTTPAPSASTETICSEINSTATLDGAALGAKEKYLVTASLSSGTMTTGFTSSTTKDEGELIESATITNASMSNAEVTYTIKKYDFGPDTHDDGGSGDDCVDPVGQIYVLTINPLPYPTISITENSGIANDGVIKSGESVTLDAGSYSGYLWSPGGAVTQTIMDNPTSETTYSVTVTDGNGCQNSTDATIYVYSSPLYVNDNNTTGDVYTTAVGNDANTGTADDPLASLNFAVSIAPSTETIFVDAGRYEEIVTINKSITVKGAQDGNATGTRFAAFSSGPNGPKANPESESIFTTPTSDPSADATDIFRVLVDDISINGIVIDGNNENLPGASAIQVNGIDVDARRGITNLLNGTVYPINNLTISNSILQNFGQRGISLSGIASGIMTDNEISQNLVRNFKDQGIILFNNAYVDVLGNTIDAPGGSIGLHLQNFNQSSTMDWNGNTVTIGENGIAVHANLFYGSTGVLNIESNTVNAEGSATGASGYTWGINIWSVSSGADINLINNNIGASGGVFSRGINFWNLPTSNTVSATGGSVGNSIIGINLDNVDLYFGNGATTTVDISNINVSTGADQIGVQARTDEINSVIPNSSVILNVDGVNVTGTGNAKLFNVQAPISGFEATMNIVGGTGANGETSIEVSGEEANLTVGNLALTNASMFFINLVDNANAIDATTVTFDGKTGSTATPTENFAIEDKVKHKMDDDLLGLVTWESLNSFATETNLGIQQGIDVAAANWTVNVGPGDFDEDVNVNKVVTLLGSGIGVSTIIGQKGGNNATVRISAAGPIVDGFTITRDGNSLAEWNDPTLNSAGVAVQGQTVWAELRNNMIYGNRTGLDVNNSNGNNIHNNIFDNNHTGLIFRNQTDNTEFEENTVINNRTVGLLFLDASSGTNSPLQQALNSSFNNNNFSGNWYGQIVDRQAGGSLPAPGVNLKDFSCNWFGTTAPEVSTANSSEPGYSLLIPMIFGGSATAPGGQPDILGPGSANFEYIKYLVDGTDTDGGTPGFQPSGGSCIGEPVVIDNTVPEHVTCGETEGSITVSYSGGSSTYTIEWTGGGPAVEASTTYVITGLVPGTYDITVTDSWGTNATTSETVLFLPVTNISDAPPTHYATIQAAVTAAHAGEVIEICEESFDEQVVVDKALTLKGLGAGANLDFTGSVSGKPALIDVTANNVIIDNINFNVDMAMLRSAIIASSTGLDAITVKNNTIGSYGTPAGSYGDRNAVSVNYGGSTNYRVASGGVDNVVYTDNTVIATPGSMFRSGISCDECGGTFTGNTSETINHDVLVRFTSNGNVTISNNNFNGGGVELADMNAGAGTISVSNNIFNFGATNDPRVALLRVKNNYNGVSHEINGNTFNYDLWGLSLENMNMVTVNDNDFNTSNGGGYGIVVNTKSITGNSSAIVQVAIGATITNNDFNGTGTGLAFLNHDSDNDAYGTFTIGGSGSENNFNTSLSEFIYLGDQTGNSNTATFPDYNGIIGTGGTRETTMACWAEDLDVQNNNFDVGSGLSLPQTMSAGDRTLLEDKIYHQPDANCLGLVTYFLPVHNLTQNTFYLTIGQAISVAAPADVLELAEWTYNEAVVIDKSLTLQGLDTDKSLQVIDGTGIAGTNSGIKINTGVTGVTIKNLTVQNFTGSDGNTHAGIYGQNGNNNLTIDNVALMDNVSASGFYANGPVDNVSITNSMVANHGPSARGIVIWNGLKSNITITGNTVTNNNCCGIELQDGDASAVNISNNTIDIVGGDNALGLTGMNPSVGPNTVNNNVITGGGRFGIEIKNPAGGVTVDGNDVSLTVQNGDLRDRAGIAIMRRGVLGNNVDVPNGVTVTNNTVTGYTQTSDSEGFGIVVEGTNHIVTGNTLNMNDVGVIQQQNPSNYPGDADQSNLADNFFGRANSPITCGNDISGNSFSGNSEDFRNVGGTDGIIQNISTGEYFCSIQAAVDDAQTLAGHTIEVSGNTFTENVTVSKSLTILGANESVAAGFDGGIRGTETILDGGFDVQASAAGTTIKGFQIQNGFLQAGFYFGFIVRGNNVTIENNIIEDVNGAAQSDAVTTIPGVTGLGVINNLITNNWRGMYLNPGSGHSIEGNHFLDNNGVGVAIGSDGQSNISIQYNVFEGQTLEGIGASAVGSGYEVHENIFDMDGGKAIAHYTGDQINASCNGYGVNSSSAIQALIQGNVLFSQWLINGTDGMPGVPGFQASPGACDGSIIENVTAVPTAVLCGPTDGSILVSYTGGQDDYTINWDGPSMGSSTTSGLSYSITGLTPGTYDITITDFYGSTATASATVEYLPVTNVSDVPVTHYATIQAAVTAAHAGEVIEICEESFDEQVVVDKALTLKGLGAGANLDFTGSVSGKPALIDVTANNVIIDNINFNVDMAMLRSAIIASSTGLDAITVKNNTIGSYGTPAGSYGDRNAVSVNYGGSTNYRVASGGVDNVVYTDNTVIATPGSMFRSGISCDECGGTFTGNTSETINHDVLVRFTSNGNVTISNNNFNGGGVELADMNAGAGTISVSNNIFNFGATNDPRVALLRVKNNYNGVSHEINGNTFNYDLWGLSLENMNMVTVNDNDFNTSNGGGYGIVVNTKSITGNSSAIVQVAIGATITNNDFNGTGTGLAFLNHDSDNDAYGTFTIGGSGSENNFNTSLSEFIYLGDQTGNSNTATFPDYNGIIGTGGTRETTMACWAEDLDVQNNNFDVGSGLSLPQTMSAGDRTLLEDKIYHQPDANCLGLVTYFLPVHNLTQNTFYLTIGQAISVAAPADVLELAEWTYNEAVVIDKSLTLQGLDTDKSLQVIDGTGIAGTNSGIKINTGVTGVTIKNLTVQNFTGSDGNTHAGIYGQNGNNNLTIDNVALMDNVSASGFYANGPVDNVSITNSMVANHGPSARGIVIWNGLKSNITITGNTVTNNNCCGIELQDGDASAVNISNNTIDIVGGDNALGLTGMNPSVGPNTVNNNVITGGGRFGIEIKNPAGGVTVDGNDVSLTVQNGDLRDRAGIAIMRRGVLGNNVDVPNGVTVTNNTVTGYTQTSDSEGFGIVVEGTNHIVTGNTLNMNDVGVIQQQNPSNYPGDADQSNLADNFFGRANSPITCGNDISGNSFSGNSEDFRNVGGTDGIIQNISTGEYFCSIQAAVDDAQTLAGHTIEVSGNTFTENVTVSKSLTILGANESVAAGFDGGIRGTETILDGGFDVQASAAGTTIKGFQIQNGFLQAGFYFGFIVRGNNVTIENNIIEDVNGAAQSDAVTTIPGVTGLGVINNLITNNWRGMYLNPGSGHSIEGNHFLDNNGVGVAIGSDGQSNISIQYNVFEGQTLEGIGASAVGSGYEVHENIFDMDGGKAIAHYTGDQINASCNGYGVNSSSAIQALIQGNVLFSPWLINGTDGMPGVPGFQASPGACDGSIIKDVIAVPTHVLCGQTVGSILVSYTGGMEDYTINWDGPSTGSSSTSGLSYDITGLVPGSYDVTITDFYGSTATTSATVEYLPVHNVTQNTYHPGVQIAIAAATGGDVLDVCEGTYNENLTVNKSLTINGANEGTAGCETRVSESIINGSASNAITISADNVTIDGIQISNSGGSFAVYSDANDNVVLRNNVVSGIGNTSLSGPTHAFSISTYTGASSNITIEDNMFTDIHGGYNGALTGTDAKNNNGSASAIAIGYSGVSNNVTGLSIKRNCISNVSASTADFSEGGKGAYGIILNIGASGSGQVVAPIIMDNTIDMLSGLWSHGIGLEGNTPNAQVLNNAISNLSDNKVEKDAAAIMVEANASAATVNITQNSFEGVEAGVRNVTVFEVQATCNWWGTSDPLAIQDLIVGVVVASPFNSNGIDDSPAIGFQPTLGSCDGDFPVKNSRTGKSYFTIQEAIDDIETLNDDVITVASGTYTENVNVTKALTINGANAGINGCGPGRNSESTIAGGVGTAVTIGIAGVTIDGFEITGLTGISSTGFSDITIQNNKISVDALGVSASSVTTSPLNTLSIIDNCIDLSVQEIAGNPTIAVLVDGATGDNSIVASGNTTTDGFYGYVMNGINTTAPAMISGGTVTGMMQGVAVTNTIGGPLAKSNVDVSTMDMSLFSGDYPALPDINFHAGVYAFTAAPTIPSNGILLNIQDCDIDGTQKPNQSSAAVYLGDFSTGAVPVQIVTIDGGTFSNNVNRGVDARGYVDVDISGVTFTNNGGDAFGAGGNDGFTIIAQRGADVEAFDNDITHPATSTTTVTAFFTGNAPASNIVAYDNNILDNGNPDGRGAVNNNGTINASENWWGDASGPSDQGPGTGATVSANVLYCPWYDDVVGVGSLFTPTVSIGIAETSGDTNDDGTICEGSSVDLDATTGGATLYSWSPFVSSDPSITDSPADTTTYTVEVTIPGCLITEDTTINVNPNPTISSIVPSSLEMCDNETVTFTVNGILDADAQIFYEVTGPGGPYTGSEVVSPATVTGNAYSFTGIPNDFDPGDYTITILSSLSNGCETIFSSNNTADFTVHPLPNGTLTAGTPVCYNDVPQLTFTSSVGTGPFTLVINGETYAGIVSGVPFASVDGGITVDTDFDLTEITDNYSCETIGAPISSFTVEIENTAPTVASTDSNNDPDIDNYTCGDVFNYVTDPSQCAIGVSIARPTWTDNCMQPVTRSRSTSNGTALSGFGDFVFGSFPAGTTIITFSGTDNAGNIGTCLLTINVMDGQAPQVAGCTPNQTTVTEPGVCEATITMPIPVFTDNCAISSITYDVTGATTYSGSGLISAGTFNKGVTTIQYTATDVGGNTNTTCVFTVTVNDNQLPVITDCPDPITIDANDVGCTATGVALGSPVVMDNCMDFVITNDAPATFPLGLTVVTWTVTDDAGSVTCTQNVTVESSATATISLTETSGLADDDGTICEGDMATLTANAGSAYLWSTGEMTQSIMVGMAGSYDVTVTDANGCTATATSSTIVVTPEITNNAIVLDFSSPICTDETTALIIQDVSPITGGTGSYTYQWEYSDDGGSSWNNAIGASATAVSYDVTEGAYGVGTYQFRRQVMSGGCDAPVSNVVNVEIEECGSLVSVKMFLEGNYNSGTGLMNDNLRANGLIPLTEPYSSIYTHVGGGGGETTTAGVLAVTGNDAIVDWVFLELRDPMDPTVVLHTHSALLQADGDVVDVDGVSPVMFLDAMAGDYFVGVKHRNHLGIRTPVALTLAGSTVSQHDFSSGLGQAFDDPGVSGNDAMNPVAGTYCIWRCNASSDRFINILDVIFVKNESNPIKFNVYQREDINLDGFVNILDFIVTKNQATPIKIAHTNY
jgi:hypothetical protein